MESAVRAWIDSKPLLLLSGEPGQGKTWLLYGLGERICADREICIYVDATGDADKTLQKAADVFWQNIKGNDGHLSLARIADRRQEVVQKLADRWLTLLIDNVQNVAEARALATQPWEQSGIRVAVSCSRTIAQVFDAESRGRAHSLLIGDFTAEELQTWLAKRFGDRWVDIPKDVRDALKRPLVAAVYASISTNHTWRPANEYELYNRCWRQLSEGRQADHPLDAAGLRRLAHGLLKGEPYPWSAEQLQDARLDNDAITRLRQSGWLRRNPDDRFEIWHDRLLNWLVAAALVTAYQDKDLTEVDLGTHIQSLFGTHDVYSGRFLGYVPLDVVWLLVHTDPIPLLCLKTVLASMESTSWPHPEALYQELLPTIGPEIIPALFERLQVIAEKDQPVLLRRIIDSITSFEDDRIGEKALALLDKSPFVQRAAMRVLAEKPVAGALDHLWELHCQMKVSPEVHLREHEHSYDVHKDSFGALKTCLRLDPEWISGAIQRSIPDKEPVAELGWLLANMTGEKSLWLKCKSTLMQKINVSKERCIAANIFVHRDELEVAWLLERIDREDGLVGAMAMRALTVQRKVALQARPDSVNVDS